MTKHLYVLSVLAIGALVFGVWLTQKNTQQTFTESLLFTDFKLVATDIERVEIENNQGVIFAAYQKEGTWVSQFHSYLPDYPVEQEQLADLVKVLMQTKLVEAKTRKAENYPRLGLQDVQAIDSLANLVTVKTANKTWQVMVGNRVNLGTGSYVRFPEQPQTWQTDKTIPLPLDQFSWLKQPILPYQPQNILAIARVDNKTWQMAKADSGEFVLGNMPEGRALEYPSILNSFVASLTSLTFEQLHAPENAMTLSLQELTRLDVETNAEGRFQTVISRTDDNYFVHFEVSNPSRYWHQWVYQVSEFSAQQLIKSADEFLQDNVIKGSESSNDEPPIDEGESPN